LLNKIAQASVGFDLLCNLATISTKQDSLIGSQPENADSWQAQIRVVA
jgi:hypothetical protein